MVTIELQEYNALQAKNVDVDEAVAVYKKGLEVILQGINQYKSPDHIRIDLNKLGIAIKQEAGSDQFELVVISKNL